MTLYSNAPILQRSTFSSYFCNATVITMVTTANYKPFLCEICTSMLQGPAVDHVIITSLLMTSLLTINIGVPASDVISILVVNWRAKPKSANLIWWIITRYKYKYNIYKYKYYNAVFRMVVILNTIFAMQYTHKKVIMWCCFDEDITGLEVTMNNFMLLQYLYSFTCTMTSCDVAL